MKNRSLPAASNPTIFFTSQPETTAPAPRPSRFFVLARFALLFTVAATILGLSSCHSAAYYYYKFPQYTYAGRPIPNSHLAVRVMISETSNGSSGALAIVDASRDIRSNVENTVPFFSISGYSSGLPTAIFNFPAELTGYVFSSSDNSLNKINYTTESTAGNQAIFQSAEGGISIPPAFSRIYGAQQSAGVLEIIDFLKPSGTYLLNIPNVYKVFTNKGDTVTLAMVHNSVAAGQQNANSVYRIFKLNEAQYANATLAMNATGAVDCEPQLYPVYCAVAVPGTFDHPTSVYYSLDGTTAYVLNCGPECGGTTASVTLLAEGPLNNNVIPASSTQPNAQIANIPVPGGATVALSDGTTLYVAGQQLQPDGLFAGVLTTINQSTNAITGTYSISDGTHTKMLFADNNTLWIGSQYCATGERQAHGQNYNCLTRAALGPTLSTEVIPNVTPGSPTSTVQYPNQDQNKWYYGSLTGLCWVQGYNKVYTAYGGQVHIFSTVDGSEIDNSLVAVPGTALDVAYMDATSDDAD